MNQRLGFILLPKHNQTPQHLPNMSDYSREEKPFLSIATRREESSRRRLYISTILNLIVFGISLLLFGITTTTRMASKTAYIVDQNSKLDCNLLSSRGSTHSLTQKIVEFSNQVTFQPHNHLGGPPSNKTNGMWESLIPRKY